MLELLHTLDWQKLNHAYGPAEDVPAMLMGLSSSDAGTRKKALEKLWMTICHQGSVYSATTAAVPFFLELVEADQVQGKKDILLLLAFISISYAHQIMRGNWLYELIELGSTSPTSGEAWAIDIRESRLAVRKGIPTYARLLGHKDTEVQSAVIGVLACLKEEAVLTAPMIYNASLSETNELTKASHMLALGSLGQSETSYRAYLREAISKEHSLLVQIAAATALSNLMRKQTPPEAVEILIRAVAAPRAVADAYQKLPWVHVHWISEDISVHAKEGLAWIGYYPRANLNQQQL